MTGGSLSDRKWFPWLICVSFANLQTLPLWRQMQPPNSAAAFFLPTPTPAGLIAALAALVIFTIIARLVLRLIGRRRRGVAMIFLLALINPLTFNGYPLYERAWLEPLLANDNTVWVAASVTAAAGILIWRWPGKLVTLAGAVGFLLAPLVLITIGNAAWAVLAAETDRVPVEAHTGKAPPQPMTRVVWFLFDEMDQRAAFEARPPDAALPAFDRFRAESFAATRVIPAGRHTITAVPSMMLGAKLTASRPLSDQRLQVTYRDGRTDDWNKGRNLFKVANERGARTGIVGWYFPYCRLFAASVQKCTQVYLGTTMVDGSVSGAGGMGRAILENLAVIDPMFRRRRAIAAYRHSLANAMSLAADPELDLVYIHLQLPHQPTVFDRDSGVFTAYNFRRSGYFDNLAAADRYFAAVRKAMTEAGLWHSSSVVISADHEWRQAARLYDGKSDRNIPLMVKLPGDTIPTRFKRPVDAILLKELILAILSDRIATTDSLRSWIDGRSQ